MKSLFIAVILFVSVKSFATCTQFNGSWNCAGKEVVINVVEENGQEVLQGSSIPLIVDGQKHSVPNFDSIEYSVVCQAQSLEINTNQKGPSGESMLTSMQKYTLKDAHTLDAVATISNGAQTQTVPFKCTK